MAHIESHQSLGNHPKTKRLARTLSVSRVEAVGHLHYLWWWALDYADDGDLSKHDPGDVADGAEWPGDADQFLDALQSAGFVDPNDHLHEWEQYGGKYIRARNLGRERQRRRRAHLLGEPDDTASKAGVTRDSTVTPAGDGVSHETDAMQGEQMHGEEMQGDESQGNAMAWDDDEPPF